MATNPWRSGILSCRLVELIGVALNAACTNLNPEGTRRHIRGALRAGATRDEILFVRRMASEMLIPAADADAASAFNSWPRARGRSGDAKYGLGAGIQAVQAPGAMSAVGPVRGREL